MQQVNLDTITDIKELKAMAYDNLATVEQAQINIKNINARIVAISETGSEELD